MAARGIARSRTHASKLITDGLVTVDGIPVVKPAALVHDVQEIVVAVTDHYVSRAAHKLIGGLDGFGVYPSGRLCLDVGASTGGFTQVLLERGASHVIALDVGHGQLAWSIRSDPRVVVRERCNARHLTAADVPDPIGALVCDTSFIGLQTVLPAPLALCAPGAWAVALIKPQFEAGRALVGSKGVVRDPAVHDAVCVRVRQWWEGLGDWTVGEIVASPITGPEGNREFLIVANKN